MSKVKDYLGLDCVVNQPSTYAGQVGCVIDQTVRDGVVMLKVLFDIDCTETWFYINEVSWI